MVSEKQIDSAQWSGVLDPQESSIPIGRFPASHSDAVCGARPSGRFTVAGAGSQGWSAFVRLLKRRQRRAPVSSPAATAAWSARLPASLLRFIKFCLVGGSGVVVDMGILYLLADPSRLGWSITLSKICAALVALTNNFIWNELWTFRHSNPQSAIRVPHFGWLRRFLLFNAICGIGIGLAVLLLHLFHTWLGWNLYLSNFLAILLVTFWNYMINCLVTWRNAIGNTERQSAHEKM